MSYSELLTAFAVVVFLAALLFSGDIAPQRT